METKATGKAILLRLTPEDKRAKISRSWANLPKATKEPIKTDIGIVIERMKGKE